MKRIFIFLLVFLLPLSAHAVWVWKNNTSAGATLSDGTTDALTIDASGNVDFGALVDVDGTADGLVLDADGDTTLSAPTDDQIDIEVSGADDFTITANTFNVLSGSTMDIEAGATLNIAGAVTYSFEDTTSTNVLTAAECGKIVLLNSTTEFATTLPAPSAGCYFKAIVGSAPASADYTIATNSGDNVIIGGVNELEVDTNDDGPVALLANPADTVSFKDGVSVVGDWVDFVSDGTYWYLSGQTNADGGVTLTST